MVKYFQTSLVVIFVSPSLLYLPKFDPINTLLNWYTCLSIFWLFSIFVYFFATNFKIKILITTIIWVLSINLPQFFPFLTIFCYLILLPISSSLLVFSHLFITPWSSFLFLICFSIGNILWGVILGSFFFIQTDILQFSLIFGITITISLGISKPLICYNIFKYNHNCFKSLVYDLNFQLWCGASFFTSFVLSLYLKDINDYSIWALGIIIGNIFQIIKTYYFPCSLKIIFFNSFLAIILHIPCLGISWLRIYNFLHGLFLGVWITYRENIWNILWSNSKHKYGKIIVNIFTGLAIYIAFIVQNYFTNCLHFTIIALIIIILSQLCLMFIQYKQEDIPTAIEISSHPRSSFSQE